MNETRPDGGDILGKVIALLNPLDVEDRERVLRAVSSFFDLSISKPSSISGDRSVGTPQTKFAESLDPSPKEFMLQRQPRTDVERIACLAYFLTNYRSMPYFKTLDLSKLNTEAAQPKFANATWASNNALKRGYLVNASKGQRQLSAGGEQFVNALPDRDAARIAMERVRPRRSPRRRTTAADPVVER